MKRAVASLCKRKASLAGRLPLARHRVRAMCGISFCEHAPACFAGEFDCSRSHEPQHLVRWRTERRGPHPIFPRNKTNNSVPPPQSGGGGPCEAWWRGLQFEGGRRCDLTSSFMILGERRKTFPDLAVQRSELRIVRAADQGYPPNFRRFEWELFERAACPAGPDRASLWAPAAAV